jgi:hypothetical protein
MAEPWPEEPTIWFGADFEPLVTIHLPREPVSQGADGRKRRGLIAELQGLTRQVPWTYTGDVVGDHRVDGALEVALRERSRG